VIDDPLVRHRMEPPPPVEVDGEEEKQVSSGSDGRIYWNQLQNLVWWTGCDVLTWEHAKVVDGLQAVEEFHQ